VTKKAGKKIGLKYFWMQHNLVNGCDASKKCFFEAMNL
jgi:hypothetical protein